VFFANLPSFRDKSFSKFGWPNRSCSENITIRILADVAPNLYDDVFSHQRTSVSAAAILCLNVPMNFSGQHGTLHERQSGEPPSYSKM
jgi:hypothetical protein